MSGNQQNQDTSITSFPNRLVGEMDAAAYLSVSHRSLQNWRHRGGGPIFVNYRGRMIRYRISDLDAWINDHLRTSTADQGH